MRPKKITTRDKKSIKYIIIKLLIYVSIDHNYNIIDMRHEKKITTRRYRQLIQFL